MYYLCRNYNSQFYYFYQELQEEFESWFLNFSQGSPSSSTMPPAASPRRRCSSSGSKKIYILIEVLGMVLYVGFFGVMFFNLYQSNSIMFKIILNMFLDFTQEGAYNFKNHIDNLI